MTIWILALVLFICLGFAGYTQGAIRVTISMIGLMVAALLAMPLSPVTAPVVRGLLGAFSVKNPAIIWAVAPVVAFIIVLTLFKVGAFALHRQVEVFYKYKAGELRLSLWERMNKRIGACLGIINALIYVLLISVVIYVMGYWTVQLSDGANSRSVRWVNRAAKDLHSTGLDKAVRALDPMKEDYYVAADIVGTVYHNPLASGRLSSYPAVLDLSESPEFQTIANDKDYIEMLQRQVSVGEVLENEKSQAILKNPELMKQIWALLAPDLKDMREFMNTGKSAKYDSEAILGRWTFNLGASMAALKQAQPNMSASQLKAYRKLMSYAFAKASFVATPTHHAMIKDVIWIKPGVKAADNPTEPATRIGEWQADGSSSYKVSIPDVKELTATADGEKIKLLGDWTPLVFSK